MAVAMIVLAESREPGFISGLGNIEIGYTQIGNAEPEASTFTVISNSGSRWAVQPFGRTSLYPSSLAKTDLDEVAELLGIIVNQDQGYVILYQEITNKILGATVAVPGTGLGFQGTQVMWVCTILILGLLIVIRDRIQHVLRDPELARDERWLLVDGIDGIEKVVAQIWLLGLLLVPSVVSSGLILTLTIQTTANGAISGWFGDLFTVFASLGLLLLNVWLSLSTVSCVLNLRGRRNKSNVEG